MRQIHNSPFPPQSFPFTSLTTVTQSGCTVCSFKTKACAQKLRTEEGGLERDDRRNSPPACVPFPFIHRRDSTVLVVQNSAGAQKFSPDVVNLQTLTDITQSLTLIFNAVSVISFNLVNIMAEICSAENTCDSPR